MLLYVDDMLIASKYKLEIERLKNPLKAEFEMKDLDNAKRILGMDITRDRSAGTLLYGKTKSDINKVKGFVDSDFAGDLDRRKSTLRYMFMLNSCLISWKSSLQSVVVLSSTEVEFIATTEAVKEAIWLRGLLNKLWLNQKTVQVFYDNQSAIHMVKNQMYHERTKHIDVKL